MVEADPNPDPGQSTKPLDQDRNPVAKVAWVVTAVQISGGLPTGSIIPCEGACSSKGHIYPGKDLQSTPQERSHSLYNRRGGRGMSDFIEMSLAFPAFPSLFIVCMYYYFNARGQRTFP